MFKNVASQKIALYAFDSANGTPKTGDAANLTAYVSKDYGTVTALTDTSAAEMDSTNAKGWYLFDVAQAETNADALLFTGKSTTGGIVVVGQLIYTNPANFTAQSIDGNGRVDVIKVAGTTQTAADLGSVATAIKAKTDSLTFTVAGTVDSNVVDWKGATAPAMTGDAFARLGAPAGASVAADIAAVAGYVDTEVGAIKAKTDNLPSDPADASDIAAAFSTVNGTLATIAGYIDTEVAAIKAKTDNLPASPAATGAAMTLTSGERTAVADALLDRDMSAGTDSGSSTARTVRQALRFLRNKVSVSGSTMTVCKEDDATPTWTAAVSTDPAAEVITGIDPAGP